jgi:subfamily B ATP-binding cassette protein MsbA
MSDPAPQDDTPPAGQRSTLVRLLLYARPYIGLVVLLFALTMMLSGTRYVRAYLMKPILDNVLLPQQELAGSGTGSSPIANIPLLGKVAEKVPGETLAPESEEAAAERETLQKAIADSLWMIVLAGVALVIATPLLMFCRQYLMDWILQTIYVDIVRDVCAKLLALPIGFHTDSSRGDILTRALADVKLGHSTLRLMMGRVVMSSVMILVGAGVMFFISWPLALASLLVGPIIFGIGSFSGRQIKRRARRRQEKAADITDRLVEILAGIKIIKAFQSETNETEAFHGETKKLFRRSMKATKVAVIANATIAAAVNLLTIAMLFLGVAMVLSGSFGITVGDIAAFAVVLSTTISPIRMLSKAWVELIDSLPSAERFFAILDEPGEPADSPDAIRIDGVHEGISLRDVTFSYGREPVLDRVSFEVEAGEIIALVGPTGSGKTTIADLLLRFHDPSSGSISIDGIDLRRIERESLLNQIAIVTQDPFLFTGTIRDNIRYGRIDASDDEILAAAVAANVDEFAAGLVHGYGTEVGGDGVLLSGGQRQRVTIARALLKNPSILILDEATSALDSKSEHLVQGAIESLVGGRTVFIIAHRLSTIRRADRIVVIENGRVVQMGTHEELRSTPGLYSELVAFQMSPVLDGAADALPLEDLDDG